MQRYTGRHASIKCTKNHLVLAKSLLRLRSYVYMFPGMVELPIGTSGETKAFHIAGASNKHVYLEDAGQWVLLPPVSISHSIKDAFFPL